MKQKNNILLILFNFVFCARCHCSFGDIAGHCENVSPCAATAVNAGGKSDLLKPPT
jgi:hypothetical protein